MGGKKLIFLFCLVFVLGACGEKKVAKSGGEKMNVVKKGDVVDIEYTGKLSDGKVFDTSKGREPLKFKVGDGELLPEFEKAVVGMKLNEEKTFTISAKDAYGERDENLVRTFPRAFLPPDFNAKEGMQIVLQDKEGNKIPAIIKSIDEKNVVLDLNHPLAGQDLTFDIKVVKIEKMIK